MSPIYIYPMINLLMRERDKYKKVEGVSERKRERGEIKREKIKRKIEREREGEREWERRRERENYTHVREK